MLPGFRIMFPADRGRRRFGDAFDCVSGKVDVDFFRNCFSLYELFFALYVVR